MQKYVVAAIAFQSDNGAGGLPKQGAERPPHRRSQRDIRPVVALDDPKMVEVATPFSPERRIPDKRSTTTGCRGSRRTRLERMAA